MTPKVYLQGACHMTLGHVAGLHKWVHESTNSRELLLFCAFEVFIWLNHRTLSCCSSFGTSSSTP
jgi:hypothetical protein